MLYYAIRFGALAVSNPTRSRSSIEGRMVCCKIALSIWYCHTKSFTHFMSVAASKNWFWGLAMLSATTGITLLVLIG